MFKNEDFEDDLEIANGCWYHIKNIFEQLDEFRAFELLRTGLDRTRYLLVKEAKIIAMTCTHAALKVRRSEFFERHFQKTLEIFKKKKNFKNILKLKKSSNIFQTYFKNISTLFRSILKKR